MFSVVSLLVDSRERLWIGTNDSGVYVPLADLPMDNSVEHILQDFEGNLWFTSSRQGQDKTLIPKL